MSAYSAHHYHRCPRYQLDTSGFHMTYSLLDLYEHFIRADLRHRKLLDQYMIGLD